MSSRPKDVPAELVKIVRGALEDGVPAATVQRHLERLIRETQVEECRVILNRDRGVTEALAVDPELPDVVLEMLVSAWIKG